MGTVRGIHATARSISARRDGIMAFHGKADDGAKCSMGRQVEMEVSVSLLMSMLSMASPNWHVEMAETLRRMHPERSWVRGAALEHDALMRAIADILAPQSESGVQ